MKRFGFLPFLLVALALIGCGDGKKSQPVKAVIYYINWSLEGDTPLSCDQLRRSETTVEIDNPDEIKALLDSIDAATLVERAGIERIDTRMCCVFYDKNDIDIEDISFDNTGQMQLNGGIYGTDNNLLDKFLEYLPSGYMTATDSLQSRSTPE